MRRSTRVAAALAFAIVAMASGQSAVADCRPAPDPMRVVVALDTGVFDAFDRCAAPGQLQEHADCEAT